MLDRPEVTRSLTGAWELFLDRPGAMRRFDLSVDGFWRSFGAVVLTIPAYALTVLADREIGTTNGIVDATDSNTVFVVESIVALCLDWITLPIVLAIAARPLGIARRYAPFIIARNWSTVIATLPFGVVGLLVVAGILGAQLGSTLMFPFLIVVLRYNYLIARRGLEASIGFAAGIVVLDFLISLTIAIGLDFLFGG
jgi:hypothetical protein